jgi:SpoVK/Ycf46/Vps4 family AAA+-type ATPase
VHVESRDVPREDTTFPELEMLGRVAVSWRVDDGHHAVLELTDGIALLVSRGGACEIVVAAERADSARRELDRLAASLRDEPAPSNEVAVRFWSSAGSHAYDERRNIEAPEWPAIASNYPARVRAALEPLVGARGPGRGSVLIWHGAPGTGKTHALRALARAWRPWCTLHYITDPEAFLASPGYLMEVATAESYDDDEAAEWRLVVLEDAGELVGASARADVGHGLSRVLNLGDGLLGQGVRCLLLVTTNEPVGRLHPALRRPGRCWAAVEFEPFGAEEAEAWLRVRTGTDTAPRRAGATLAELFAVAAGHELEREAAEAFGFARALAR